jgi:nucleotide-binding universal stress UspA family protein
VQIKRIVVPLDGSQWSETVLPYVAQIAGSFKSDVTLIGAIHNPATWVDFLMQIDTGREVDLARSYLEHQREELANRGIDGETSIALVHGEPAQAILDYAKVDHSDLVAMTTHGRSGVTRWAWGSVADKVLHSTDLPLLLVRPRENASQGPAQAIRKILVPLDGSELSQSVLPFAETLAKALGASVVLFHAALPPMLAYPGAEMISVDQRVWDTIKEEATKFVTDAAADLTAKGIHAVGITYMGQAVDRILAAAGDQSTGLIVMSTHGRSGAGRFVMGSVADAVVRRAPVPVLVVRPRENKTEPR